MHTDTAFACSSFTLSIAMMKYEDSPLVFISNKDRWAVLFFPLFDATVVPGG
jgi:hypothetical protein